MVDDVLFSSRSEEWETPQDLFDYLDSYYHFGLDVCATKENAKCEDYFTKETDGLKQDWCGYGTVWMNPPYGKDIYKWMKKAVDESRRGCRVVCLIHARTDTRWWHDFAMRAAVIYFIKGRLSFGKGTSTFPSVALEFEACRENNRWVDSITKDDIAGQRTLVI